MSWRDDKAWADLFIPEIQRIVGPYLLVPSSFEQDTQEAADLVVLKARDLTVACRVRRPGYEAYANQFTIRCQRDSGTTTELEKITNGWGDWMFYGFASSDLTPTFSFWHLIDLAHWRAHLIRDRTRLKAGNPTIIKSGTQANRDGTHFAWFDIASFPYRPSLLVASSYPSEHPHQLAIS